MNKLPEDFDVSSLVGHAVEMVCFSAYQVYLHFDRQLLITIEGDFSYQADSAQAVRARMPVLSSSLMQAVGAIVQSATGDAAGTLTLVFDNGQILKCYDSSPQYESYQIQMGERLVVV